MGFEAAFLSMAFLYCYYYYHNELAAVPDWSAKEIVEDILSNLGSLSDPPGMIFVKEVSDAYEIGSKQSGEATSTSQ